MEMKWLFLLTAVYVAMLVNVPDDCDVTTLQQCTKEEIHKIHFLEKKTKEELILLLEMEDAEVEVVRQRYLDSLSFIVNEIQGMEEQIDFLSTLFQKKTLSFQEKMIHLKNEYRNDLTRRFLASAPDRNANNPDE